MEGITSGGRLVVTTALRQGKNTGRRKHELGGFTELRQLVPDFPGKAKNSCSNRRFSVPSHLEKAPVLV